MIHGIDKNGEFYQRCNEENCDQHHCDVCYCSDCSQYWCHRFFEEHPCAGSRYVERMVRVCTILSRRWRRPYTQYTMISRRCKKMSSRRGVQKIRPRKMHIGKANFWYSMQMIVIRHSHEFSASQSAVLLLRCF
jgi:hypothetical protein